MQTIETIKAEFHLTKLGDTYHNSVVFPGHGDMCDVYFQSSDGELRQEQVDSYNQLLSSYKRHLETVDRYIFDNLSSSETKRTELIRDAELRMDVLDIPYDNPKYDCVLFCGKSYRGFLFSRQNIDVRIEFRNGAIQSVRRNGNLMKDND